MSLFYVQFEVECPDDDSDNDGNHIDDDNDVDTSFILAKLDVMQVELGSLVYEHHNRLSFMELGQILVV